MKSLIHLWGRCRYIFLVSMLSIVLAGCKENGITDPGNNPNNPPPENDQNVLEIIQENDQFSILEGLLEGSTLSTTLSGSSTVTVFAPTDAAFAKLPNGYLEGLTSQQKLELLKYHVFNGNYPVINEIKRESIPSLHGDPLFVEIGQSFGNLLNNQAKFDSTNIEATNGLIHIIDAVLVPDQFGTLADNIRKRYEYRKFYERMETAGLVAYLHEPGTKTVLPEHDMTMDSYQEDAGLSLSDEDWKKIMQYHVLEVDVTVTGPGTKTALATLSGDSVYLKVDEPGQFLINGGGGNPVTVVNATNGKIVSPSGIMLPDKFLGVLTIMDKRFNLQTARAALAVAKLTGRLYNTEGNGEEKFSIFIPKDNAEGINSLPSEETGLANTMKYHILLEDMTSDQLQHNQTYTTWQGEQITITKNGNEITINGAATIRQADLAGKNGVVHVINRVLEPPIN